MTQVTVLIGAGSIGQAIIRRIGAGKHILLSDVNKDNLERVSKELCEAGFKVTTTLVDISDKVSIKSLVKTAISLGKVKGLVHAAGVSPSQASKEQILRTDLYGTAVILEEFGKVIEEGGSGIVISSQSGHRLPPLSVEENEKLATTSLTELLDLPMLQSENIRDNLHAYQLSKRGNALRVMAQAVHWGKRKARLNTISPGIIFTPLANDELNGPRGDFYKKMLENCPAGRGGTPDEVANVASLLMGEEGGFITGSDFLMDGGATSSYLFPLNT